MPRLLRRVPLRLYILRLLRYQRRLGLQQLRLRRQHLRLRHCWPWLPGWRLRERGLRCLVHLWWCILHGRLRLRDDWYLVLRGLRVTLTDCWPLFPFLFFFLLLVVI